MATPISISYQPADDGDAVTAPRSAYLPFIFKVENVPLETGIIKVGYCICNIFVDGELLISIANSAPYEIIDDGIGFGPIYKYSFDIASLLQTVGLSKYRFKVFCNFQMTVIQDDGTISDPTYLSDNSFVYNVLNLALQPGDGLSVTSHLGKYIIAPGYLLPLSHRPKKQLIGLDQEDTFSFFNPDELPYSITLTLCYRILGQPVYHEKTASYNQTDVTIPFGPGNLSTLFPTINFANLADYYLRIGETLYTPTQVIDNCTDKDVRIFFINYLGTTDAVNMKLDLTEHITESEAYKVSNPTPLDPVLRHSNNRMNIKANNTYTVSTDKLEEKDIPWLQELADSPKAWIQGDNQKIPIVIEDGTFVVRKGQARYRYTVSMKFTLSNDFVTIRN